MMIKVLILETGVTGGGSFESLFQHVKHLDRNSFNPVVVFFNKTEYYNKCKELGVSTYLIEDPLFSTSYSTIRRFFFRAGWFATRKIIPFMYKSLLQLIQQKTTAELTQLIREHNIDIIHTNIRPDRDFAGIKAGEQTGIPVISHLRSYRNIVMPGNFSKFCNKAVNIYIANSEFIAEKWSERGLKKEKVKTVYNGIKLKEVKPASLDKYDIPKDSFVFSVVSRLIPGKGHTFLFRAIKKFVHQNPHKNAHFLIIGAGPQEKKLRKLIKKLDLEEKITMAGYIEDPLPVVKSTDGFILPTRCEAFGRVLLEAMLCEIPIIATKIGGIPEIITHEENGLLIEYGEIEETAKAIEKLVANKSLREKLVRNGIQILRETFTIEETTKKISDIYSDLTDTEIK